jgi:hypothetical protein
MDHANVVPQEHNKPKKTREPLKTAFIQMKNRSIKYNAVRRFDKKRDRISIAGTETPCPLGQWK